MTDEIDHKPIPSSPEYEAYISFDNMRIIKSHKSKRFLKPTKSKQSGYWYFKPCTSEGYKNIAVHVAVYNAFHNTRLLENSQVDHIDQNKDNNHLDNLREATCSTQAQNRSMTFARHCIQQYSWDGETLIRTWRTCTEAAKEEGYDETGIKLCCEGKRKHANGFVWRNADKITDTVDFIPIPNCSQYRIKVDEKDASSEPIIINRWNTIVQQTWHQGHWNVNLTTDAGSRKTWMTQQLVALTFIPNPNDYPMVLFKNKNPRNCHPSNLFWGTAKHRAEASCGKGIEQIDPQTGEVVRVFPFVKDAYIAFNKTKSGIIQQVCKGKKDLAFGFKWRWQGD